MMKHLFSARLITPIIVLGVMESDSLDQRSFRIFPFNHAHQTPLENDTDSYVYTDTQVWISLEPNAMRTNM